MSAFSQKRTLDLATAFRYSSTYLRSDGLRSDSQASVLSKEDSLR